MLPPEHLYHNAINTLSVGTVLTETILKLAAQPSITQDHITQNERLRA